MTETFIIRAADPCGQLWQRTRGEFRRFCLRTTQVVRIFLAEVNETMGRVKVLVHSAKMVFQRRERFAECGLDRIRLRLCYSSRRFRLE